MGRHVARPARSGLAVAGAGRLGRGGWYTPRWVDRLLFPANGASTRTLLPGAPLSAGDWVPDGPPETECGFTVYAGVQALVVPADAFMSRGMMRGLAWRVNPRD